MLAFEHYMKTKMLERRPGEQLERVRGKYVALRRACLFTLLYAVAAAAHAQVQLMSWDAASFHVRTGEFFVWYDSSSTEGALFLAPSESATVVLANLLCGGDGLEPLRPEAFRRLEVAEDDQSIRISVFSSRSWGELVSTVTFWKNAPGMVHWRVKVNASSDFSPWRQRRPLYFLDRASGNQVSGGIKVHTTQAPWAAGLAYFSESRFLNASLLFFENFTSLNRYFEIVRGGPQQAIYLGAKQLGYVRPVNAGVSLPKGEWVVLEDSYLVLEPGVPQDPNDLGLRFLRGLARILRTVDRPWASFAPDWLPIAQKTVRDLEDPSCWVEVGGRKYLRAYVNVPRYSSAEAIAQLDVLCPLAALEKALGDWNFWNFDDLHLIPNLVTFVQPTYRVFVNDTPSGGVTTHNGWYQLQLLIDLAELVRNGGPASELARTLLKESLPVVIGLAQANGYRFYEGFRYGDYSVWGRLEADATGGYAYLMLDAAEIFADSTYLSEARTALQALPLDEGFNFTYEAHFSAITASALARMAAITGDPGYLERAYLPLASLLRIVWWWECDYGYARSYQTFGGLSPMIGAGVITPKEQYEAWWYLREFLELAPVGGELPADVRWLVSLFLEETPRVCYYTLPPHLPRQAVWTGPTIYNSVNKPELMIPLEDLRQGWEQSGKIGQEIYGAGMALAFASASVASRVGASNEKPSVKPTLDVWPNPANKEFFVRVRGRVRTWARVWIVDVLGRRVCGPVLVAPNSACNSGRGLNLNGLPGGVYFVIAELDWHTRLVAKLLWLP